jgi:CRISPR/Cas system Type II protein with McrA/HNH and RuvC-like nuclease domain
MALKAKNWRDVGPMFWDVAKRDGGKCMYCGLDGSQDVRILSNLQLDHLIPRRANGRDYLDNLVLCCCRCNGDKGQWNPAEETDITGFVDTEALRKVLIEKARQYVETQHSDYYTALYEAIKLK